MSQPDVRLCQPKASHDLNTLCVTHFPSLHVPCEISTHSLCPPNPGRYSTHGCGKGMFTKDVLPLSDVDFDMHCCIIGGPHSTITWSLE